MPGNQGANQRGLASVHAQRRTTHDVVVACCMSADALCASHGCSESIARASTSTVGATPNVARVSTFIGPGVVGETGGGMAAPKTARTATTADTDANGLGGCGMRASGARTSAKQQ